MDFKPIPLTVIALDNGVTGSIDPIQYEWLKRRLQALRDSSQPGYNKDHCIVVLVGIPFYVDGKFSAKRKRPSKSSYSRHMLYELLQDHRVDVVMGGDTHAYQRYIVHYKYKDKDQDRTMHHIMNGGGGAYLSPPIARVSSK